MTLLLALALEWVFGDPQTPRHPVAWFGRFASAVERRLHASERIAGVLAWVCAVGPVLGAVGAALYVLASVSPWLHAVAAAALVWITLGWRSLLEHVRAVAEASDLECARKRVGRIVGRDTDAMTLVDVRRAALESLAENASDAVVASLFWLCVAGPLGALLHRMANTLDAMWGHRSERYADFGWCAARIDDVLNWVPARLMAACYFAVGWTYPSPGFVAAVKRHPSPNAGWPELALAEVLDVRLGGAVRRRGGLELRPWLGREDAREPDAQALAEGIRCTRAALGLIAGVALLWSIAC